MSQKRTADLIPGLILVLSVMMRFTQHFYFLLLLQATADLWGFFVFNEFLIVTVCTVKMFLFVFSPVCLLSIVLCDVLQCAV